MKQMITLKNLLLASCIAGASIANGQVHPLAFGSYTLGTTATDPNWYADYVGLRFVVNSPASVAGQKIYTHPGIGTTPWGATVTTPIVNTQIIMPQPGDSLAGSPITVDMSGRIGYVYRGGGIEFVCKALEVQNAGGIACVIVNNINGGPVGMGAGSVCAATSVTIPVFMISKEEGDVITALYNAADTARFTITPWGLGLANDLGFVPSGVAGWHNYAIPSNQLGATGNPSEYNMVDGSFIANYGSADATGVNVVSTLSFTPDGSSTPAVQHTNTVTLAAFTGTATVPTPDSIYAMFDPTEYSVAASGKGRFDLKYDISSAVADDYPADNSMTTSFYVTDSLYSKSRYDFTSNNPVKTIGYSWNSGGDFLWGPMYYVKNGGTSISRVQYSLSTSTPGPLGTAVNIYLFKWVDGSGDQPMDSVVQNGELTLASLGVHNFDGVNDTSGANLNFWGMGDPTSGNPATILLDANSWYYLAIGVPGGHFLGSDGIMHPYPRVYGRYQINPAMIDYSNVVSTSTDDITANPTSANTAIPGAFVAYVNSVDSFNFNNTRGMIPSVAMIANNNPVIDYVNPIAANNTKVTLFPNPAKDYVQVALSLENVSKKVTYTIIDGLGRFVSKEVHNNVKEENFTINTSKLPAGHYFFVVNTDDKAVSRNFVIAK
jgi:hypothetical protein